MTKIPHLSEGPSVNSNLRPGQYHEGTQVPVAASQHTVNQAIADAPLNLPRPANPEPSSVIPQRELTSLMSRQDLATHYPPTSERDVRNAVNNGLNQDVTLWRGATHTDAANIARYGTAGGVPERDENTRRPTRDEAMTQLAGGSLARDKRAKLKPTEYTTSQNLTGFGTDGTITAVRVNTRYLEKGSGTEGGWTVHHTAPVEFLGAAKGPRGYGNNRFRGVDAG